MALHSLIIVLFRKIGRNIRLVFYTGLGVTETLDHLTIIYAVTYHYNLSTILSSLLIILYLNSYF